MESLNEARWQLDKAMREPGHSPTEDALLDALVALLDSIEAIEERMRGESL